MWAQKAFGTLAFGFLLALMVFPAKAAEQSVIRLYGVDLYIIGTPKCQLVAAGDLRTRVSPFRSEVRLEDMLGELARRALETNAKVVHSIVIETVVPHEGGEVSAKASNCADSDGLPFDPTLTAAVRNAHGAIGARFLDAGTLGQFRTVESAKVEQTAEFANIELNKLRALLLATQNYDRSPGLQKSCPFDPTFGFRFISSDAEVWWLISEPCQTAAVATASSDWRRIVVSGMSQEAINALRKLASVTRLP